MSIKAIVENDMNKLPIHVPNGTSVEVWLPGERDQIPRQQAPTDVLEAFRKLQSELGLSAETAADWKNRVADAGR